MSDIPEYTNGVLTVSGYEDAIDQAVQAGKGKALYSAESSVDFAAINSACCIALHMHQPLIPAGGADLHTADIIVYLQYMFEHPDVDDNHNAHVFHDCYKRLGYIIPELMDQGNEPRAMLEYSGTLLYGLQHMGKHDVVEHLRTITCQPEYRRSVEWLACPWGHAVAPSTPVQDYRLHIIAWQHHFAALFGLEALSRVRGFSPSEMALPNQPDVAYEFVKTLKECGLEWVMVQEHTVERPADGHGPEYRHLPHRLVCRNSKGESESIIALIKTQGSDTKLVAQMQPWYEASGLSRLTVAGKEVPRLVTQIADGENGGVMMNEFPPKYKEVAGLSTGSATPLMNGSEYLDFLFASGITVDDLPELQPIHQKAIWDRMKPGDGPEKLEKVIEECKAADHRFHMEGGSWTNNISWVKGYENVIGPMEKVSSKFNEKVLNSGAPPHEARFQQALFLLMCTQTSCYRYWGQGHMTDYGRELCRRAEEFIDQNF